MKLLKAISLIIVGALLFALTSCVSAPTGGDTSAEPSQTANQIDDQQNNTETEQETSADPGFRGVITSFPSSFISVGTSFKILLALWLKFVFSEIASPRAESKSRVSFS